MAQSEERSPVNEKSPVRIPAGLLVTFFRLVISHAFLSFNYLTSHLLKKMTSWPFSREAAHLAHTAGATKDTYRPCVCVDLIVNVLQRANFRHQRPQNSLISTLQKRRCCVISLSAGYMFFSLFFQTHLDTTCYDGQLYLTFDSEYHESQLL